MPHFIKTGYWEQVSKGKKGWLNIDKLITDDQSTVTLVDSSVIDITSPNSTLSSSASTRTFTISYTGNESTIEVILGTTSATYTFPSNSLCVTEGIASGDNTLGLAGVSGDKYIIGIRKINNFYYIVAKNFGQ